MFGPVRGPWPDESWKGWWGDEPPNHTPVFVLTHHARKPLTMKGGTEFRFVTDGIHAALQQAKEAAGNGDVRLAGGVATSREIYTPGSSTSCTWPSRRCWSVAVCICLAASICGRRATNVSSTSPALARPLT